MKTAMASPDGPDKKNFGIPKKDKKGLAKKTEYKYESKTMEGKKNPKPKSKDNQNIGREPKDKNPHMNPDRGPMTPKSKGEDLGRKKAKDSHFEKSYKVVPNTLKKKENLNKKDAPSTKKGKQ
jgi:hypothetical protein